ncbi:DUF6270 domain-containing protein [Phenylobacterium sp. J367]|uniref:DUF6270 domain-containing protein n=1 Tax=Phenylobacterium sp. J367 TaxID=2898435 RepID=UPI002150A917|nr:DUF6270 domain-containing protein [Phenylobacterium sp. J367]MCR5877537.1 DUF6270 domain-containing protein [Phenylobacterium sp. J367]
MPRVAIVGSCITRDLWPIRGDGLKDLAYVSRTSFPSLMSRPVPGFAPAAAPPEPLKQHQHRAVVADLRKTALAQLVAFRPTHVIFDFIDERFDLYAASRAIVTRSWELEVSGYLTQAPFAGRRRIPRLSAACDRLWLEALAEFAAFVRATPLAHARLILHSARWATASRTEDGTLRPVDGVEIMGGDWGDAGAHNALLARYEADFLDLMPPVDVVAAPDARIADDAHQWGVQPLPLCAGLLRRDLAPARGAGRHRARRAQCSSGVRPEATRSGFEAR